MKRAEFSFLVVSISLFLFYYLFFFGCCISFLGIGVVASCLLQRCSRESLLFYTHLSAVVFFFVSHFAFRIVLSYSLSVCGGLLRGIWDECV